MFYNFSPNAWDDYSHWENDRKTRKKISDLLKDISRNGAGIGIGKPEALTGDFAGYYSRRIDDKNRLIYKVEGNQIFVISCRLHHSNH